MADEGSVPRCTGPRYCFPTTSMPFVLPRPSRRPLSPSAARRLAVMARGRAHQAAAAAAVATALAFTVLPAWASEPPEKDGLSCTATNLTAAGSLRLEVTFANTSAAPMTLPAAVHLALYRDAAATDGFEDTARVDRLQRTPLVVPATGRASALFIADAAQAEALLCSVARPAAAALTFYEFSRRPTFRCVLKGEALAAWPKKPPCAASAAGRGEAAAKR